MTAASLVIRRERLDMRRREAPNEVAPDDLAVIAAPDLFLRMEEILIGETVKQFGATIIDTTDLNKEQGVAALAAAYDEAIQ